MIRLKLLVGLVQYAFKKITDTEDNSMQYHQKLWGQCWTNDV